MSFWRKCALTRIRPVVVWPEMSSPAQSFASVTQPISASGPLATLVGLPVLAVLLLAVEPVWQVSQANIRHDRTSSKPTKKVMRLEHRKAYQCLSAKHSSTTAWVEVDTFPLESAMV